MFGFYFYTAGHFQLILCEWHSNLPCVLIFRRIWTVLLVSVITCWCNFLIKNQKDQED